MGTAGGKRGGRERKTKIESDQKRELLWKADRHKQLPNSRLKSVNEVPELHFACLNMQQAMREIYFAEFTFSKTIFL